MKPGTRLVVQLHRSTTRHDAIFMGDGTVAIAGRNAVEVERVADWSIMQPCQLIDVRLLPAALRAIGGPVRIEEAFINGDRHIVEKRPGQKASRLCFGWRYVQ